jgi:hypothetical protein
MAGVIDADRCGRERPRMNVGRVASDDPEEQDEVQAVGEKILRSRASDGAAESYARRSLRKTIRGAPAKRLLRMISAERQRSGF